MTLGFGVFFCSSAELAAEQRCPKYRQADLNRKNTEAIKVSNQLEHHDRDINHGKGRIEDGGEGLTGEKIAIFSSSATRVPSSPTGQQSK